MEPDWPTAPGSLNAERYRRLWWEQVGVLQRSRTERIELLHVPYFAPPLIQPVPTVVTIHDVIPLILPEYRQRMVNRLYNGLVAAGARRAAAVIAVSECSKRDIVQTLDIPASRVHVIPNGVGAAYQRVTDPQRIDKLAARYGTGFDYVLYCASGFDVRKNVGRLLEAYAGLPSELRQRHRLVLAGQPRFPGHPLYPDPYGPIAELGISGQVTITGEMTEAELAVLYSGAALFVFPSLYEGFGIPVLEAMACGAPVISSNASSLPEVTGDAAWLLNPLDVRALTSAMAELLEDPLQRKLWADRGLKRASQFPWRRVAEATLDLYEKVAGA
jgi:glycosyltransferase involved in cell wall biosynthesis